MNRLKTLQLLGSTFFITIFLLVGSLLILDQISPAKAADETEDVTKLLQPIDLQQEEPCDCSGNTSLSCFSFRTKQDAQKCYDYCVATVGEDIHGLDTDGDKRACESWPNATATPTPDPEVTPTLPPFVEPTDEFQGEPTPEATETPQFIPINLVQNGNFEAGFYGVPELGFEARDIGFVPNNWGWYKNQAYGKYTIGSNETFGLNCPTDVTLQQKEDDDSIFGPIPGVEPLRANNTLALHIQSSDEQDTRLGVYQTVNVVPGQDYRFTMSATIQVQAEARTLEVLGPDGEVIPYAPNHTFELYFDHTGNTDWTAIPFEKWMNVPIPEEKLFFSVEDTEKKGESALAVIYNFKTFVKARSNKMTIFITGWRKWANFRSTIFDIDCVWLSPVDAQGNPIYQQINDSGEVVQTVAIVQPAATKETEIKPDGAQPTAEETETVATTEPPQDIPVTGVEEIETQPPEKAQSIVNNEAAKGFTEDPSQETTLPAVSEVTETKPEEMQSVVNDEVIKEELSQENTPSSGGILKESSNTVLVVLASAVAALGLIGTGIWSIRRRQ